MKRKGTTPKSFRKERRQVVSGGLTAKGVRRYRAANPGSKLKTAVTTKPSSSRLAAKTLREESLCARMKGMKRRLKALKLQEIQTHASTRRLESELLMKTIKYKKGGKLSISNKKVSIDPPRTSLDA